MTKVLLIDDGSVNIATLVKLLAEDATNEVIVATDEKDVSPIDKLGATIITSDMIETVEEEEKKTYADLDFLHLYPETFELQNIHSEPLFHDEPNFLLSDKVQKSKRTKKKKRKR